MRLLVISHKEVWQDADSPTGYSTVGGFAIQMRAIAELFDETTLIVCRVRTAAPSGRISLDGHRMKVQTVPQPRGTDAYRKLWLLLWIPIYLPILWRAIRRADAVHAPVPGDVGTLGLLIAAIQRKRLFVRHCGTWDNPTTLSGRLLRWLLEGLAGGKSVVFATGGADHEPSSRNPQIGWIFSTALSDDELRALPQARPWRRGETLRLLCVCRLSEAKNVQAAIGAVPLIARLHPQVRLDVLGDGDYRKQLHELVSQLSLQDVVTLHGNASRAAVYQAMAAAHVLVFPTRNEGFPKVILEALACGLPIVASNVSVIPALIRDCGLLLETADSEHVADAILRLTRDETILDGLGARARERARNYTLEAWQAQIQHRLVDAWGADLRDST